jgi:hypothetical protein
MNRLVEAGDWEGVVLAAAQFEGESDADDGTRDQVLDDGSEPSLLARGRDQKLESIRNEVELLVRRIVPDELGKSELLDMRAFTFQFLTRAVFPL